MSDYNFLYEDFERHIVSNFNIKVIMQYDSNDAFFSELNMITINKSNPWKHRFYSLLHEFGHFIVLQNKESYSKNYPKSLKGKTSRKDVISIIAEEIDAWHTGRDYTETVLNINIDQEYFNRMKTNCVMTYVVSSLKEVYGKRIDLNNVNTEI